jgi:uroporphyrinogen-III synthase
MITSVNALESLQAQKETITDLFLLPCFCVGASTGTAARAFGFTNIHCGSSDSIELAHMLTGLLSDKTLPVLHIAGDTIDGKAHNVLTQIGLRISVWVIYRADMATDFTPETRALFAAQAIVAVPIFSPRTARALVSIIEKNRLTQACYTMTAIGLSQAVANVLQTLPWQHLRVAAAPSEDAVLACLPSESLMTSPDTSPEPPRASIAPPLSSPPSVQTPPKPPSKHRFLWSVLGIILLVGGAGVIWLKCPLGHAMLSNATAPVAVNSPDVFALQRRVQELETRMNALRETPPETSTPPGPAPSTNSASASDITALTEDVKNLQTQVTQSQNMQQYQTRKNIAAAFAFWDLREAAQKDRPFADQLATLRMTTSDDAAITAPAAKLGSYAATGVPTLAQVRSQLTSEEAAVTSPPATDTSNWWEHIKSVMQNMVSVHPLHNPQFAALENALDADDEAAALDAFTALPQEAQQHLTGWHDRLRARLTVDDALREINTHFTAPATPEQGITP